MTMEMIFKHIDFSNSYFTIVELILNRDMKCVHYHQQSGYDINDKLMLVASLKRSP